MGMGNGLDVCMIMAPGAEMYRKHLLMFKITTEISSGLLIIHKVVNGSNILNLADY